MEFISEKTDYNVPEFYEHFRDELPKLVKVNQGYFGEIASDVFDKDQVIWLNAISKQKRVIAKFQLPNHSMRLLSIPVTYEEKLCVVKHGKLGKPKALQTILEKGNFPVTVQFPKDHKITVGNHSMSTNHIPKLELSETFEEMYFLGNLINEGEWSVDVIDIPLYLSQLRLSLISGIKDETEEQFKDLLDHYVCSSATIVYDNTFGNPDIAEYDPSAIHSCDVYSYMEPTIYSNIVSLVNKPIIPTIAPFETIDKKHSTFAPIQGAEQDPSVYDEINIAKAEHVETKDTSVPPIVGPKPPNIEKEKGNETPAAAQTSLPSSTLPKPSQNIPATEPFHSTSLQSPSFKESSSIHEHAFSENKQKNGPTHNRKMESAEINSIIHDHAHGPPPPVMPKPHITRTTLPFVNNAEDVAKLSIDEVGEYLKRLKLDKYVDNFKDSMIDGHLLGGVTEDMLLHEFGFKKSEVLRLLSFAKSGRLPLDKK